MPVCLPVRLVSTLSTRTSSHSCQQAPQSSDPSWTESTLQSTEILQARRVTTLATRQSTIALNAHASIRAPCHITMTTLKSFQAEIEAISHEKHALQIREAREAHIAAELAKHHGRLPPKKEKKEDKDKAPATAGAGPQKGEAGQGAPTSPVAGRGSLDGIGGEGHDDGAEASLEVRSSTAWSRSRAGGLDKGGRRY